MVVVTTGGRWSEAKGKGKGSWGVGGMSGLFNSSII